MERIVINAEPVGAAPPPRRGTLAAVLLIVGVFGYLAFAGGPGARLQLGLEEVPDVEPATIADPIPGDPEDERPQQRFDPAALTIGGFDVCNPGLDQRLLARQSAAVPTPLEAAASTGWEMVDLERSACDEGLRLKDLTLGWQGLVAVGSHEPAPTEARRAMIWTSRDGLSWFLEPDRGAFSEDGRDVEMLGAAAIEGAIAAVGRSCSPAPDRTCEAGVWVAPLAESWTRLDAAAAGFGVGDVPMGVEAAGSTLFAFGRRGPGAAIWSSQDGRTWKVELETNPWRRVLGIAGKADGPVVAWGTYIGSRFDRHSVVWLRSQGGEWTELPYQEDAFGGPLVFAWFPAISEVAATDVGLIAVGQAADLGGVRAIWRSEDGRRWSLVHHDDSGRFDHVAILGADIVAWSRSERPAVMSRDGRTWDVVDPPAVGGSGSTRTVVRSLLGVTALVDDGTPHLWTFSYGRL